MSETEKIVSTVEQTEIFMNLQKLIIKLYGKWDQEVAIAVFAGALGSAIAFIEKEFKEHVKTCPKCQSRGLEELDLNLLDVALSNMQHHYEGIDTDVDEEARKMVDDFLTKAVKRGRKH
jgi:hypothetical protein